MEPRAHFALMREPFESVAGRYLVWMDCMGLDLLNRESGQIEHGAEIRVFVAKVRRKTVYSNILCTVGAPDRDKLPAFVGQCERIFECAKADKFCEFQAVAFPALRASYSAR